MNPSSKTASQNGVPALAEDSTKMKDLLGKLQCERTEARLKDFDSFVHIGHAWIDLFRVFKENDVVWVASNAFLCLNLRNPDEFDELCKVMSKEAICLGSVGGVQVEGHSECSDCPCKIRVYATEDCWNKCDITDNLRRTIFGFLFHLFQKQARRIEIDFGNYFCGMPPEKPTSFLVSQEKMACLSGFEQVKFHHCWFPQDQCQVLGAFDGLLSLANCGLEDGGKAIFEAISNGQGPRHLRLNWMKNDSNQEAMRKMFWKTKTLKTFAFKPSTNGLSANQSIHMASMTNGLRRNQSLTELEIPLLRYEKEWQDAIWSLARHPKLQKLRLTGDYFQHSTKHERHRRANILLEVLKMNQVLCHVSEEHHSNFILDNNILQNQIRPLLKENLRRAMFKGILNETDGSRKSKLLSMALSHQESRLNPSFRWLLVSNFWTQDIIGRQSNPRLTGKNRVGNEKVVG